MKMHCLLRRVRVCMSRSRSAHQVQVLGFSSLRKYDRNSFLQSIGVKSFSQEEIKDSFDRLKAKTEEEEVILPSSIQEVVQRASHSASEEEVTEATRRILGEMEVKNPGRISREDFSEGLRRMGLRFDHRVRPIVACYLVSGVTIGIIVPCMPLLVSELNISSAQFGLIVSSFGVAKLLGNIPSSHYVDTIGRRPLFFAGLGLAGVAIGGMGLSLNPSFGFPWVLCCRVMTGLGVSAIVAGGNMMVADISTALNRTQTQAPLMSAWQVGMVAGPGVGGMMIDAFGLANTYFSVGAAVLVVSGVSYLFVQETKPAVFDAAQLNNEKEGSTKLANSVHTAISSWKRLLRGNKELGHVVLLNGSFWAVMSGVQLTMLPLLMVTPGLDMTASQIGLTFISLSVVSLLTAQPLAYLADNFDKHYMFAGGCCLLACSSLIVPSATTPEQLAMLMIPFAVGSSIMQNVPTAHVINICATSDAPQAMSLLRTVGDIGLILGAAASGLLASMTSVEMVIQSQGTILFATLGYIAYQRRAVHNSKL